MKGTAMNTTTELPLRALKAHVGLNVSNIESSIAFYRNLFGVEPVRVRKDYAKFDIENPPLNLTMNLHPTGGRNVSHMGIQVATTEDVIAVRNRWAEAGLDPSDEMGTECCYALQDKAWVSDPDGNEWEVFTVLRADTEESTVCCTPEQKEEKIAEGATCCDPGAGCC